MARFIESKNQKGGITADTVNIHGQLEAPNRLRKNNKRRNIIITSIFVIAAIVGILEYLGIKPWRSKIDDKEIEKQIHNVTSYNQKGGITAYNVNVGSQDRHLTDGVINQLSSVLPEYKNKTITITITSVMGDQEAFQFASEINEYLKSVGYTTNGVNQAVYSKPMKGQILNKKPDGNIEIIIGGKN